MQVNPLCYDESCEKAQVKTETDLNWPADVGDDSKEKISSKAMKSVCSEVLINVRLRQSSETEFIQILMPTSLSFESLVCKICACFRIRPSAVRKLVKVPDVLLCSAEDVRRLKDGDRVEVVLCEEQPGNLLSRLLRLVAIRRSDVLLAVVCLLLFAILLDQQRLRSDVNRLSALVYQRCDSATVAAEIRRRCYRQRAEVVTCSQSSGPHVADILPSLEAMLDSVRQSLEGHMHSIRREIAKLHADPQEMLGLPKSLETISNFISDLRRRFSDRKLFKTLKSK